MEVRNRVPAQKRKLKDRPQTGGGGRIFFATRLCSCCGQPLGLFLSRGSNCPKCGLKVCKKCKIYNQQTSMWNCLLCSKNLQTYGPSAGGTLPAKAGSRAPESTPFSTIKRSWSISATNRSSPVLKSYTKYNEDPQPRQFNSLPRMPSNFQNPPSQHSNSRTERAAAAEEPSGGKRARGVSVGTLPDFPSTLHPFRPSSSAFYLPEEELYWDYYDYEFRSNRSSCERSLGETVELSHSLTPTPPKKPERRKSRSMGAFDAKYSQLKTYCLINTRAEEDGAQAHSHSLPRKKKRSNLNEQENDKENSKSKPNVSSVEIRPAARKLEHGESLFVEGTNVHFSTLPRREHEPRSGNHHSTLPRAWKLTPAKTAETPRKTIETTTTLLNAEESEEFLRTVERQFSPAPARTFERQFSPAPARTAERQFSAVVTKTVESVFSPAPSKTVERQFSPALPRTVERHISPAPSKTLERQFSPAPSRTVERQFSPAPPRTVERQYSPTPPRTVERQFSPTAAPASPRTVERQFSPTAAPNSSRNVEKQFPATVAPSLQRQASPARSAERQASPNPPPAVPRKVRRDYLTKEVYPSKAFSKTIRPLFLLSSDLEESVNRLEYDKHYQGGLNQQQPAKQASSSDKREVIIEIAREFDVPVPKPEESGAMDPAGPDLCPAPKDQPALDLRPAPKDEPALDLRPETVEDPPSALEPEPRIVSTLYSSSDSSCTSCLEDEDEDGIDLAGDWTCGLWAGASRDVFLSCDDVDSDEGECDVVGAADYTTMGREEEEEEEGVIVLGISPSPPPPAPIPTPSAAGLSDSSYTEEALGLGTEEGAAAAYPPDDGGDDEDDDERGTNTSTSTTTTSTVVEAPSNTQQHQPSQNGLRAPAMSGTKQKYKSRVLLNSEDSPAQPNGTGSKFRESQGSYLIPIRREGSGSKIIDNGEEDSQQQQHVSSSAQHVVTTTVPVPVTIIEISSSANDHEDSHSEEHISNENEDEGLGGRRESPEGEECVKGSPPSDTLTPTGLKRSSPDGGCGDSDTSSPTPVLELPSGSEGEDSTDSWTEEVSFEDTEHPPPLDLTLHTIVEESCEESEPEPDGDHDHQTTITKSNLNELEKYYNFTVSEIVGGDRGGGIYEESEFSDTFSESSFSSELRNSLEPGDPVELASGRLEKYFLGLGLSNDSDSVGSESETDGGDRGRRRKVLKHHRRSAEFEDDLTLVSEDEDSAFVQEGLDTIKKTRKGRRSNEDLLEDPPPAPEAPPPHPAVSRSNSFTWSSDEEVNLMMSKLRHLIKGLAHSKKPEEEKNERLVYLENQLVRLMQNETSLKDLVEGISEEEEEDVYRLLTKTESPTQPLLLSKVMTHIGQRLSTWMRDEELEETATIRPAPSMGSDLNEDRFSWKGSFESTLAKRQSVGSSDSIDGTDGAELFSDRSILRSSSLHHLANSQPILEESESLTSSLSRLNPPPSSNPSSSGGASSRTNSNNINRARSLFLSHQQVKSARYRPPGYFESPEKETSNHASTPVLSTFYTTDEEERQADSGSGTASSVKVRGQVEFLMQYNYKQSTFELCIKQCRDLAAAGAKRGRSDPYVKAYLLPDRTKSSKRKTKTKKNTLNPVFGETLKFPIPLEELEGRTLCVSVWHSDIFGKNEFLGQVLLGLRDLTFDETNYVWYPLVEQQSDPNMNGAGDGGSGDSEAQLPEMYLILALKWTGRSFKKGNLTLLVKEAKGLPTFKNSPPSTFVKCTPLSDRSKKQKTGLCRKSQSPVWNSSLTFENVSSDGLELALMNSELLLNHDQIAGTRLDYDSELWREMGRREGFWVEGVVRLT